MGKEKKKEQRERPAARSGHSRGKLSYRRRVTARRERRGGRDRAQTATAAPRWILIKTVIRKKRRAGGAFAWKIALMVRCSFLASSRFVVVVRHTIEAKRCVIF